jgi:hypothetical protein
VVTEARPESFNRSHDPALLESQWVPSLVPAMPFRGSRVGEVIGELPGLHTDWGETETLEREKKLEYALERRKAARSLTTDVPFIARKRVDR